MLEKVNWLRRHDCGDCMLVDKLHMGITTQQYAEIVEPTDHALMLDTIYEENRDGDLVLPDMIQEYILYILRTFACHLRRSFFLFLKISQCFDT